MASAPSSIRALATLRGAVGAAGAAGTEWRNRGIRLRGVVGAVITCQNVVGLPNFSVTHRRYGARMPWTDNVSESDRDPFAAGQRARVGTRGSGQPIGRPASTSANAGSARASGDARSSLGSTSQAQSANRRTPRSASTAPTVGSAALDLAGEDLVENFEAVRSPAPPLARSSGSKTSSARAGAGRSKARSGGYRCSNCGLDALKWVGQCDGCGEWNTLEETVVHSVRSARTSVVQPICDVPIDDAVGIPSGIPEFDRVLGGGLSVGSVLLIGGEPGIGKSTLLLQVLGSLASQGERVLYVTAEESASQVAQRAARLGLARPNLALLSETSVEHICECIGTSGSSVVVIDSIQTVATESVSASAGSVSQVRACAQILVSYAKARGITLLIVGHVTKDGSLAGPRLLEHLVDTVLSFEGDRYHTLRFLRAVKHRFGPTSEVGLMSMDEAGLEALDDPSGVFLADRMAGMAGSAVMATIDGRRPLVVEIQALLVEKTGSHPRRSVQGLDPGRVDLLLAVLQSRCHIGVAAADVFAVAMGGARVLEPAADLAVAAAVVSAARGRPIDGDVVLCGEIGLSGELRQVGDTARRLSEAARLGFRRAIMPKGRAARLDGIDVRPVSSLAEALDALGLLGDIERSRPASGRQT